MNHEFAIGEVVWTGNTGSGTSGYRDYRRDVSVRPQSNQSDQPDLELSADKAFRGDPTRWNPEQLLIAALSECHLLSYLHVAVMNGVVVTSYVDHPSGTMAQQGIGGRFTEVILRPRVGVAQGTDLELANKLHHDAAEACFIAASVNFPVSHEPEVYVEMVANQ